MGKFFAQCLFHTSWISCITYLTAISSYTNSVFVLKLGCINDHVNILFNVICYIIIGITFLGIVLLRVEATHIVCALMVSIPLGILVPAMSGYTLYMIRTAPVYNVGKIQTTVLHRWHAKVVPFLDSIQQTHKCCGLFGPTDYREFIYRKDFCKNNPNDIPTSCINQANLYRKCSEGKDDKFCFAYNFTQNVIVFKDNSKNQQMNALTGGAKLVYKCNFVKLNDAEVVESGKPEDALLYKQGCMKRVVEACQSLRDSHYFFLFVMVLISWSMVISFLSNWFEAVAKVRKQIQLKEMTLSAQFATIGYIVD